MEKYNIEILDRVIHFNVHLSQRLHNQFIQKLDYISTNPFIYPRYHYLNNRTVRYFVLSSYIYVYYVDIDKKTISIVYSFSSKQDVKKIVYD